MKHRNLNPWYIILWRLIWAIPYFMGLTLSFIAVLITLGLDRAIHFWKYNV
jgi:hypothetical protein